MESSIARMARVCRDRQSSRPQVSAAQKDTSRWISKEGNSTGFAEWLRCEQGIYWIQGKPASGKSTLMNYTTQDPQLQRLSAQWTGETPLVISSFWFWAAGSKLQKSLVGLFRTLLCQILKKEPELCRVAFREWQTKFKNEEPSLETLVQAINNIVRDDSVTINTCSSLTVSMNITETTLAKPSSSTCPWRWLRVPTSSCCYRPARKCPLRQVSDAVHLCAWRR